MKKVTPAIIVILFIVALGAAWMLSNKEVPQPIVENFEFASPVTLHAGEHATYSDGLTATLVSINDSRCPKGVVCVWQGELSFQFKLLGGNITQDTEIRLGTETAKSLTQSGYTFTLDEATEDSSVITVTKGGGGILPYNSGIEGIVTAGPTCPVMQYPPDPQCNDKPLETNVSVYRASDTSQSIAMLESGADGTFKVSLPPGEYVVMAGPFGVPLPRCSDTRAKVEASGYTQITVSCDTGIR